MKQIMPALLCGLFAIMLSGCATSYRPASGDAISGAAFDGEAPSRHAPASVTRTAAVTDSERVDQNRMLIWRARLSLEVDDVGNAVSRVTEIAGQSGGYVETQSGAGLERASITLRVPVEALRPAIDSLETIGQVTSRGLSSQDVTEQYVDIEARLKTMLALRERLVALLDKAQDVRDVLSIEQELSRVQADIDSMQARLKVLKGRVDLASLSVTVRRKRVLGPLGYLFKGAWWSVEKLFVIR